MDAIIQSGIYQIRNLINGKLYVGSAINFSNRWKDHKKELNRNNHRNSKLQHAWKKYGKENFSFEAIEIVEDKSKLIECEQHWLDYYKSYNKYIGYNIAIKAGSSLGIKRSEETKFKQRNLKLGRKLTKEHREAISKSNMGRPPSAKAVEKLRKRSIGNKFGLGYKHTQAVKDKISIVHKGKPKSADHIKKMSENAKRQFAFKLTSMPLVIS